MRALRTRCSKGCPEETQKKCPRRVIQATAGVSSLSVPACDHPHEPFFLLMNTGLASLLSICVWKLTSAQAASEGLITGHWSLGSGGQDFGLRSCHCPASVRAETLLQATAGPGHRGHGAWLERESPHKSQGRAGDLGEGDAGESC